jgi:hypothetical protein
MLPRAKKNLAFNQYADEPKLRNFDWLIRDAAKCVSAYVIVCAHACVCACLRVCVLAHVLQVQICLESLIDKTRS